MESELTVGEQVVLLALDEDSGTLREPPLRVGLAVAAVPLIELARSGHVVVHDGKLVAATLPPTDKPEDPVVAAMAEQVRSHSDATPHAWLLAVREQALSAAYAGLLAKGLVRQEGRQVLKAFGSIRYPVTDPTVPAALRSELAKVVLERREVSDRMAVLIAVLHHAGLPVVALSDAEATAVEARMAEVAQQLEPATTLGEAVHHALAAIAVVIATSGSR